MKPYSYICSKVADFNYLFGVISHSYPNDESVIVDKFYHFPQDSKESDIERKFFDRFNSFSESFDKSQVKLRFGLINEEIKELEQAIKDKNPIEIIDALCDILYVVAGAKVYFNFAITDKVNTDVECTWPYSVFYNSSYPQRPMSKNIIDTIDSDNEADADRNTYADTNTNTDICLEEGLYLEGYYTNKTSKNIIESLNSTHGIASFSFNNETMVLSNLTNLFVNEQKMQYNNLLLSQFIKLYNDTLDNIVVTVFNMCTFINIDIIRTFDIVHNSNMTKICDTESDAKETVEWYKINELRYKEPNYRKIHYNDRDYYVVYDMETNKILKSIKYNPAKFI